MKPKQMQYRPRLEMLEDRLAPAVGITAFNVAEGAVRFEGDLLPTNGPGSITEDTLILFVQNGNLAHNLADDPSNGMYDSAEDVDPGPGTASISVFDLREIIVRLASNDDLLVIDNTTGFLGNDAEEGNTIGITIDYDGGEGRDRLEMVGDMPIDASTYIAGPTDGTGLIIHQRLIQGNGGTPTGAPQAQFDEPTDELRVAFSGLEPVLDVVPSPLHIVEGTPADNAINYSVGTVATNGLVTIDNFESNEFSNKAVLVLNALAGNDVINLNNPNTPTGLTEIQVFGMDSTVGDTLIVNGTTGQDTIDYSPLGTDAGTVTGAQPVPVTINSTENLTINGLGGNDSLTVTTPTGVNTIQYDSGATTDSATVRVDGLLSLDFLNLGATGTVTLADFDGARTDNLIYNGTTGNDTFSVAATTGDVTLNAQLPVATPGVDNLTLNGLAGPDIFNLAALLPYTNTTVNAGGPDTGDILNLTGTAGGETIQTFLESRTITGFGGMIAHSGAEDINIDGGGGADTLEAVGTAVNDRIVYRPTGTSAGRYQNESDSVLYRFNNITGTFLVTGDTNTADTLVVEATSGRDTITIDGSSRTVQVNSLKTVTLDQTTEILTALGREGDDTFSVTPALGPGNSIDNLLINIDGGPPGATDALIINAPAANQFVVINRSRTEDEGTVRVFENATAMPDISYTDIEIVSPNVFIDGNGNPNLLVMGPDEHEPNEFRATASFLGSGETLNVFHASIFPRFGEHPGVPSDEDFYRIIAQETGTLDFQVYFRQFDPALLPAGGNLEIEVQDALGNVVPTIFGVNDTDDDERIRIPVVAGQSYYLRVFGAPAGQPTSPVVNGYDVTIINTVPPMPHSLELEDTPVGANSDTGRSQNDNITNDNTPSILIRVNDAIFLQDLPGNGTPNTPPDEVIPIPFNPSTNPNDQNPGFRVAVFDETNTHSPVFLGFAQQVAGQPGNYRFTPSVPLADGSHFITARVQMIDPAVPRESGFGEQSLALEIFVDTAPPPVFFGSQGSAIDGLDPSSDSGVQGQPATFTDRITNDTTPSFFGFAEADSIVRLYVDRNNDGLVTPGVDVFIGETVAVPFDGTNQFPDGQWNLTSIVDMNNPAFFPFDGLRRILATSEDVAGNVSRAEILDIFIDTQGPQITNVFPTDFPTFDLFDPKPLTNGPTPAISSLTISLRDLPNRVAQFIYGAVNSGTADNPGLYEVRGDHVGQIGITRVVVNNSVLIGQPATGTIQLFFNGPLPDDRYTLIVSDTLRDNAGNQLDGESNAIGPLESPLFPTGDGQAGGQFRARFTVDSRPEIATYCCGSVYVDINGNGVFDPEGQDNDAVNRDIVFFFGDSTDVIFAGKFAPQGAGSQSGFDMLGAYGQANGQFRFLLDFDSDGVSDANIPSLPINGRPFAGNFTGSAGDEVGLFDGQTFYIDTNGNNTIDAGDVTINSALRGFPIAGDFDGDGKDDLATWRGGVFQFDLASNGLTGTVDATINFDFNSVLERPVAADLNIDGIDDIGLFVPGRDGVTPREAGEFYFLVSNGPATPGSVTALNHAFRPEPFGTDQFYQFGDELASPLVGNFDPPLAGSLVHTIYVNSVYNEVLGRSADSNGLRHWVNLLNNGAPRSSVALSLVKSREFYSNVVTDLYQEYLHRTPDQNGQNHWVNFLQSGGSIRQLTGILIGSDEYFITNGGSVDSFLGAVYLDGLNRSIESAAQNYWGGLINNGTLTRPQAVDIIFSSREYLSGVIEDYYQSTLNRSSDTGGRDHFVSLLQNGLRQEDLLALLLSSDEFFFGR